MQDNNRPWEVLASRFQEFFQFLRSDEDLDIAYEHLIGLAEKAGRDFYHLAQSETIVIPNEAYWNPLSEKPVVFCGFAPDGERSFWEWYWILALRWLAELPGSGVYIAHRVLLYVEFPSCWDEYEIYTLRHEDKYKCFPGDEFMRKDILAGLATSSRIACAYLERVAHDHSNLMFWRGLSSEQDRTSTLFASDKARTIDRLEHQRKPQYDAELRELRYGDALLKRFSQPAANQVLILQAFEECRWPNRIDSPLPPAKSLPNTVRDLNRNMKSELMRFRLDGEGIGVVWELTAPA